MGYSIYYDRAFICVGEQYIPLVCSGASNVAEWVKGRRVSEKNWQVLNWKRRDRALFSELEISEIAKDYERLNQDSGMCYKSRYKPFAPGEFESWIMGGIKRAHTIEEYRAFGNAINVVDYPNGMIERWRLQPVSSEAELLALINQFGAGHKFHISFNSREITRPTAKSSVRGRIAEAREEQRNATGNRNKTAPGKGKPSRGRSEEL